MAKNRSDAPTDRVQYLEKEDRLLTTATSGIVPERNQWVVIGGEEWKVYHVVHTVEDGEHTATVFVWQPDGGWSDEDIEQTVKSTLRAHRRKEREP